MNTNNSDLSSYEIELFVKSYFEPVFYKITDNINKDFQKRYNDNIYLAIVGGDALNYYYPAHKQILSNDFDIRLVRLGKPFSVQDSEFLENTRISILNIFLTDFKNFINEKKSLKDKSYFDDRYSFIFDIEFKPGVRNEKTYPLVYEYEKNNIIQQTTLIDISFEIKESYIYKNNMRNIFGKTDSFGKLLKSYDNLQISQLIINNWYIVPSIIEILIQDKTTGAYYMTLGDIINDTVRMILLTSKHYLMFDNPYNPANKIKRYIEKYINLLETLNVAVGELKCNDEDLSSINNIVRQCKFISKRDCEGKYISQDVQEKYLEHMKRILIKKIYLNESEDLVFPNFNRMCALFKSFKIDNIFSERDVSSLKDNNVITPMLNEMTSEILTDTKSTSSEKIIRKKRKI